MPEERDGLVVWGGGSPAPARERQRQGAAVVTWPGSPGSSLEAQGVPFRAVEDVVGPEGLAAADTAARTWARVWGRLPLVDGKSFRDLVEWRGTSLLWCAEGFLRDQTAGPRCARTAEIALRLLEATTASEVDAPGLLPGDALLLRRACTVRGVLFHGPTPGPGRPLAVARPAARGGLGRVIADALAPARPPALPTLPDVETGAEGPLVAFVAGEEERLALGTLLEAASDDLSLGAALVTLAELPRWETRAARRAASRAEALLREQGRRLRGTPGLTESYSHRGVGFADLASSDLEALLEGHLPAVVRRIEAARELLVSTRAGAVLLAVPGRDERRTLLHACASAGVAAVVLRLGPPGAGEADRADAGPRPLATLEWERDQDPRPVVARLREAARGRVEAG
jgi:hypothetical protein